MRREQSSEKFRGAERLFRRVRRRHPGGFAYDQSERKKNHKRASHRAFLRRVVSNNGRGEEGEGEGKGGGATAAISVYLSEETQSRPE